MTAEYLQINEQSVLDELRKMTPDKLDEFQTITDAQSMYYREHRDYYDTLSRLTEQVIRENAAQDVIRHMSERD